MINRQRLLVFKMKPFLNSNKKDKGKAFIILLCLSMLLFSCSTFAPQKHQADFQTSQCLPNFSDQDGWYGADGAYSIQLDSKRTLWLFGDTFVSEDIGRKDRIGMDVVLGTTLAISTCSENATFNIRYYLKKKNGIFVSSFGNKEFLWPQDPFIAQGTLYIPLLIIQALPDVQPPFNFRVAGHKIARIKDFKADDPHSWPVDYLDWTNALPKGIEALAATSVVYQNHVYFYPLYRLTQENITISGNIVARIPVDHLDNPANHFEYWTQNNTWHKELNPKEVKIIFPAGLSEMSVRYHAQEKQWMAVFLSPENKGNKLLYSTAENPEGPWSPSMVFIDSIAEVDPHNPLYDSNTFCYAGKEHHQFAQNGNLVVTYVCNSSEDMSNPTSFLRRNIFLYRPVVKIIHDVDDDKNLWKLFCPWKIDHKP